LRIILGFHYFGTSDGFHSFEISKTRKEKKGKERDLKKSSHYFGKGVTYE
jgi:hypothetical protein